MKSIGPEKSPTRTSAMKRMKEMSRVGVPKLKGLREIPHIFKMTSLQPGDIELKAPNARKKR